MSVNSETASAQGQTIVLEKEGVYASLFEKINLTPASSLGDINAFLDDAALSDAPAGGDAGVYGLHPQIRSARGEARQNAD